MGILHDGATLAYMPEFRQVAAAAGVYIATEVLAEDASTPQHELRRFFAHQVILNPEAYEGHFGWLCAVDPAIAGLGSTLTGAHEGAVLQKVQAYWTFLAEFYHGSSFGGAEPQ